MDKRGKEEVNCLLKNIGEGDEISLSKLYEKMYKVIFCFLKSIYFLDDGIIEDVIVDAFLIIIKKAKTKIVFFNGFSWMLTIADNTMKNFLKKHKRIQSLDETNNMISFEDEDVIENLGLKLAVEKLPCINRKILYLKYYVDFTYKEIGSKLKISEATVKRKIRESEEFVKEELNYGKV